MTESLEQRMAALEAKVHELDDREQIRLLRFRYHECINEGKFGEIAPLFSADGELDFGHLGKARGRDKLVTFFATLDHARSGRGAAPTSGISFVKQFIHNHVVELAGDRARGFSYLEAKPIYDGESYLVAARYDDEYVREGGRWLFSRMSLTPFFMVPLREGWAQENRIKMGRR